MFGHFYNESLRKLVVAFGSLFNDIYVARYNSDSSENSRIKVPLIYSSKEKFLQRLEQQSGISDETKLEVTLPRMGFDIASIDYDPTRHLNKLNKRYLRVAGSNEVESFQEVPYNVAFTLFAYTRNMDDNLQIVEQIVPYFSPEFIVTLNMNQIETKLDVPIVLGQVAMQETYDGNFMDRRIIASTFSFVCKTRLYSKIEGSTLVVNSSSTLNEIVGSDDVSDLVQTITATGSTSDYAEGDAQYDT